MSHYVYIIANRPGGALYIDVARDLARRGCERRERAQAGFRAGKGAPLLVYFEEFPTLLEALAREKVIKACSRDWKIRRIERMNPDWDDLTPPPADSLQSVPAINPPLPAHLSAGSGASLAARPPSPRVDRRAPSSPLRRPPPLRYPVS
jgi:putative endonuclease